MPHSTSKPTFNLFTFSVLLTSIASGCALAVYAYLGTFSRHMADDYCSVGFTRTNFFVALWDNYLTVSDRFSNFMFIALSEGTWPRSVAILPALMIVIWVSGIAWLLHESLRFTGGSWPKVLIWALSLLLVFFALLQAPNRFQTLYWRSSMATHLVPLVLMPLLASFLLRCLSSARVSPPAFWKYPLVFFLSFLLGGFSEPTALIMISLLAFSLLAAWKWTPPESPVSSLWILGVALAGAVAALVVMALAPANSLRLGDPPPAWPILIERSFRFAYEFMLNSFRTLPLPTFFTVLVPLIIFFGLHASSAPVLTSPQQKRLWIVLAGVPVLAYLLIVASFAPSVYGQSFPVERARFAGQLILVAALMIEGSLLGTFLAQWRPHAAVHFPLSTISAILLLVAAIYPLRAAVITLGEVPAYRERAQAWDARDAQIRSMRAEGQTDLTVPQYNGVDGVKELDTNASHWINHCAAVYYEVNSIRAISVKKP
ncbi:MAG: DUF6056 family protein [Chloroflexota bacterium]